MLALWGMRSTPLLPSVPGLLWPSKSPQKTTPNNAGNNIKSLCFRPNWLYKKEIHYKGSSSRKDTHQLLKEKSYYGIPVKVWGCEMNRFFFTSACYILRGRLFFFTSACHISRGRSFFYIACHISSGRSFFYIACHISRGRSFFYIACHISRGRSFFYIACHISRGRSFFLHSMSYIPWKIVLLHSMSYIPWKLSILCLSVSLWSIGMFLPFFKDGRKKERKEGRKDGRKEGRCPLT